MISIVDDDPGIRQGFAALMKSAGLDAEAFSNAEDFLESGRVEQTRCLVLDVHLPCMSGLELQARLAEMGRRLPIVFLTAHQCDRARALAIETGAAAYLLKPLRGGALLASVRAALEAHA